MAHESPIIAEMSTRERRKSERRVSKAQVQQERRATDRRAADRRAKENDRRTDLRIPMDLWMEEVRGDEVYFRRSCIISEGGVLFEQSIPHPEGTEVTLRFEAREERGIIFFESRTLREKLSEGQSATVF